MSKSWLLVILAGIIEILWVIGLAHSSNWFSWLLTILLIILSFVVLIRATEYLPVATVYVTFTGIGTAGTVMADIIFFGDPFSWTKIFFIVLLVFCVAGLQLVTPEREKKEETM